ncbi:hypothetical protein D9M69_702220 [compost metagenome]
MHHALLGLPNQLPACRLGPIELATELVQLVFANANHAFGECRRSFAADNQNFSALDPRKGLPDRIKILGQAKAFSGRIEQPIG